VKKLEIISVQFQDKTDKTKYAGREYSYYTAIPVKVGDFVAAPQKFGTGIACVSRVNVSAAELKFDIRLLKTITAFAKEQLDLLSGK
jgi:hypothetical protein